MHVRTRVPLLVLAAMQACERGFTGTGPSTNNNPYGITATGPGVLSGTPLQPSAVLAGTPLGYMASPGHLLPTGPFCLYFVDA